MKNISRITLITIITLLCSSCTEVIDLDLNNGDNLKVVVNAWLDNSGREQVIELSLSTDYYDVETADQATGAIVTVSSDTDTYTFTERDPGQYHSFFDGKVGQTFTLNIDYKGERFTSTQKMNRVSELEEIEYVFYEEFDEENHDPVTNPDSLDEWDIHATFQEPVGKGDFYYFGNFKKTGSSDKNLYLGEYYEDDILDGTYFENEYVTYGYYEPGDTIITQMFSITEDVYEYLGAVDEQTDFRGFIFDTPPANVPTNISNDGKGYFIVSAVSEVEKVLE